MQIISFAIATSFVWLTQTNSVNDPEGNAAMYVCQDDRPSIYNSS